MKTTNGMLFAVVAVTLLALGAGAVMTAVSEDAPLDTRSISAAADETDQSLDARSFTVEWSDVRKLNTKKIIGAMIMLM